MILSRGVLCLLALLLVVGSASAAPLAQDNDTSRFFPANRHWVSGEFLTFYDSAAEPERLFGEPITGEFPDVLRPGFRVQYFERARMDYDPSQPVGERVSLAPLGEWLYDEAEAALHTASTAQNNGFCRAFASGRQVCYAFLQFYDLHDGTRLFGEPVSDLLDIDGRYLQYFQNVRLEWRTELPPGQRVVVSELGRIDFDKRIGDARLLEASSNIPLSLNRQPRARAFVSVPLAAAGAQQRVDVVVRDQFFTPMSGQIVTITVRTPGQPTRAYAAPNRTDAEGLATVRFLVEDGPPNQVVEIQVEVGDAPDGVPEAVTWFRTWW